MPADDYLFEPEELDDLLAPIALYPDPLIAQILPAATFIDQVDEAARFVKLYGASPRIDYKPWDVSVKAVAYYPTVLFMMDQRYDWTVALGQAYVNQPDDVLDAIQRLRAEALAVGNLTSTSQQQVIVEGGYIRIVPAQPTVIYVPQYDPAVVYWERPQPSLGLITFGIGFTIGAWLNRDCDWREHRVYYHGWQDGGWVGRARPHVRDRRNVYINNQYTTININKRVVRYDTERFRGEIRRDVQERREWGGRPAPRPGDERGRVPGFQPRDRGERRAEPPSREKPAPRVEQPRPAPGGGFRPALPGKDERGQEGTVRPGFPSRDRGERRTEPQQPTPRVEQPRPAPGGDVRPVPPDRDERGRGGFERPGSPPRDAGERRMAPPQEKPAPRVGQPIAVPRAEQPRPDNRPLYRGRETGSKETAPASGFGGYGTRGDASTYRERGQSSRENIRRDERPQPAPAPVQRPTPAPSPAPPPRPAPRAEQPRPAPKVEQPRPAPAQRQGFSGDRQNAPKPAERSAPRQAPPEKPGKDEGRK
jgi:hypothetical protein